MLLTESWVRSLAIAEMALLLIGVAGYFILRAARARKMSESTVSAVIALTMVGIHVLLKLTYVNTGTVTCLTQEFAIDQLAVIALGFAIHAFRKADPLKRFVHVVILLVCAGLILVAVSALVLPDSELVSRIYMWRNEFAGEHGFL